METNDVERQLHGWQMLFLVVSKMETGAVETATAHAQIVFSAPQMVADDPKRHCIVGKYCFVVSKMEPTPSKYNRIVGK